MTLRLPAAVAGCPQESTPLSRSHSPCIQRAVQSVSVDSGKRFLGWHTEVGHASIMHALRAALRRLDTHLPSPGAGPFALLSSFRLSIASSAPDMLTAALAELAAAAGGGRITAAAPSSPRADAAQRGAAANGAILVSSAATARGRGAVKLETGDRNCSTGVAGCERSQKSCGCCRYPLAGARGVSQVEGECRN